MEKEEEQQSGNKSKRNEAKGGSLKISGSSSINGGDASSFVGSIIEKGIVSSDNNISKPIQPPQPSVLPFPVARHRSQGPHWTPISNRNVDEEDEEDEEDESVFRNLAKPVQRKEKKGLNLSRWKELMQSDDSSKSKGKETNKSPVGKTERQRKAGETMKNVGKKSMLRDSLGANVDKVASMDVDVDADLNGHRPLIKAEEALRTQSVFSSVTKMDLDDSHQLFQQDNNKDTDSDNFDRESGSMAIDDQANANRIIQNDSAKLQFERLEKMDSKRNLVPKQYHNFGNEQVSVSLDSEIDAENCARLESMSSEEIAQAQAEIMEKMDPALLNLLKKRGQEKLKKPKHSSPSLSELDVTYKNQSNKEIKSSNTESSNSPMLTSSSNITKEGLDNGLEQNVGPLNGSLWNAWSRRVEAVRELRFSMDGTVVQKDFVPMQETSGNNIAERDFLRTEGDPGAAGYTIKEAVALTRSLIPGQRVLALHLLASVLDKALHNIYLNPVGSPLVNNNKVDDAVDWEAVWAFALGPEPGLVLSLRMSLDDNHNSVVLATAKVIRCILSCDLNGTIFDFLEKTAIAANTYTAPIFRSKPEIDVGFLHGGFWKYSAKPSNILLYGEKIIEDETEGTHTIQDDIVFAGQDFAAGLIRMGILPMIRYLLEMEPAAPLEECLISILIAIARHSPTSADAIMKCQRLVQTIVHRFTTNNNLEVYPSKIKSVCLLKVLAQSNRKNCVKFIENGSFQAMTWHLYRNVSSLEQWLKLGRENFRLSSALMVEQLRFWKVCIQNGYCVSYFSNVFPALCLWLNPPTIEKLVENNVVSEYASISTEAYLVLESLAGTLPSFYSHKFLSDRIPEGADDNMETWSWSHVGPMVDLAVKWISFKSSFIDSLVGIKGNSVFLGKSFSPFLWVYSAVMHMLSRVLERVIPEDSTGLKESGHNPWLPDFVPKVGLEIIRNGFLSFTSMDSTEYGANLAGGSSFIEQLCSFRQQSEFEASLASVCCLHGFFQLFISIDRLIHLAKDRISNPSSLCDFSQEKSILAKGILMESLFELRCVFSIFSNLIASEWQCVQSAEIFGRGGPVPGVGLGWGSSGGGFWSKTVLLAQTDARLFSQLLEIFQIVSIEVLPADEDRIFTMQMINSVLGLCLTAGPGDKFIVEKALDVMFQVPVLKYLDLCIQRFIQSNKRLKLYKWKYEEDDYFLFGKILASHFQNRWLSNKKKLKASSGDRTSKGNVSLDTIPEEPDPSNMMSQDHGCNPLIVEWAHQRLPLPMHWFLSPISTLCDSKHAGLGRISDVQNIMQDPSDILEVAKAGMFFLLGLEAMSTLISAGVATPILSVPLIWKVHSLSIILLTGMAVLEEEKSSDVYESLQELYAQLLDETRSKRRSETILNMSINFLAENGRKDDVEFLRFQSDIHESYSTFIDTLVEQYAAVSFGDLTYGRQVALYLHRCVESPVRLATWNALSNSRVLELLPSLQKCLGEAEGYLEPLEENEGILEAYAKSWVSGALDRAATRGSIAFSLALHHLSSFVFISHRRDKLLLRNKLVKSLLRDYARMRQHEGMMLEFIQYNKPYTFPMAEEKEGLSSQRSNLEERLEILEEACEGNPSLLKEVEKLKSSLSERTVAT